MILHSLLSLSGSGIFLNFKKRASFWETLYVHGSPIKMISYVMLFVHNDRLRIAQNVCVHIDRIYEFEHLLIENRWNDRLGFKLG